MSRRRRKRREPRTVVGIDPASGPDTTALVTWTFPHAHGDALRRIASDVYGIDSDRLGYDLRALLAGPKPELRRPTLVPEGPYLCSVHDDCREHPTQIREDQPHIAFECARLSGRVGTVLDMRAASAARFSRVRWRAKRLLDRLRSSYSSRMVFPAQSGAAVWAGAPAFLDANGMVTTQSTGHPFGRVLESHGNDVVVEVFRI